MLLSSDYRPSRAAQDPAKPLLVFLHGFLGSGEDFAQALSYLTHYPTLSIDLPGFGASHKVTCLDINHCLELVKATINQHIEINQRVVLVGYSMGGRLLLTGLAQGIFASLPLIGAVVEGAHFGLSDDQMRESRRKHDEQWAQRFEREPMEAVLKDWYQQPVFGSLLERQRQELITMRSHNDGRSIAAMLRITSLSAQGDLRAALHHQSVPIHSICGDKDSKFKQLAEQSGFATTLIEQAGHNTHYERPQAFARALCVITESLLPCQLSSVSKFS
ncbi:2-succinyl-6-hydroxy-2,4-cyclohexadiene-1-carboxylate synthase [Vibrio sp. WXL103]|uniref:2-succinyl-6-hydroxy-2, 4-cyclohexadiene-1-carboxylate synthase n=1 Tax=unclassified Vibrio TaxID=2614977 RepID=UPI003EC7D10B